jgi:hypothetical protein
MRNSLVPYLNNQNESTLNPQILTLSRVFGQNESDKVSERVVSFNIFYDEINYNLISDVSEFTEWTLFANLAGICGGSFIGVSVMSFLEFLEFVLISMVTVLLQSAQKLGSYLRAAKSNVRKTLA